MTISKTIKYNTLSFVFKVSNLNDLPDKVRDLLKFLASHYVLSTVKLSKKEGQHAQDLRNLFAKSVQGALDKTKEARLDTIESAKEKFKNIVFDKHTTDSTKRRAVLLYAKTIDAAERAHLARYWNADQDLVDVRDVVINELRDLIEMVGNFQESDGHSKVKNSLVLNSLNALLDSANTAQAKAKQELKAPSP